MWGISCFKSSLKWAQVTKVWQVNRGFKSQPPQCHPFPCKPFSAANSHPAKQKTKLILPVKPCQWSQPLPQSSRISDSTEPPPPRISLVIPAHHSSLSVSHPLRATPCFKGTAWTPQGYKSDEHPQKHPKRTAQHLKYCLSFTWLHSKGLWSSAVQWEAGQGQYSQEKKPKTHWAARSSPGQGGVWDYWWSCQWHLHSISHKHRPMELTKIYR